MVPVSLYSWWDRIFLHTYYLNQYEEIDDPETHWLSWIDIIQKEYCSTTSIEWNKNMIMHIKALSLYNPEYILDNTCIRMCISLLYQECTVQNVLKIVYYSGIFLSSSKTIEAHRLYFYRLHMENLYTYILISSKTNHAEDEYINLIYDTVKDRTVD